MISGRTRVHAAGMRYAGSRSMPTFLRNLPFLVAALGAVDPACAELPSFDDFFREVSECRLDMQRYGAVITPTRDGMLISLPSAGAVRGFLVDAFYVAAGGPDEAAEYGLLFNAPLDSVYEAFPEFAGRHSVNGYVRRLASLAEQSRERNARRKTLLICAAGLPA